MKHKLIQRPELQMTNFHGLVTVAPQMFEFFTILKRVARTDATVLIRGETGTGKELAARILHQLSPRANGPWQAVNCATLTSELLASELFGHKKGAFTGAIADRKGLFELADGGSLFLDEIGEMSLDVQARLLRVLQERVFVPVGGTEAVRVNVRVISATNKALREEAEKGRFREDLMYRIRVVKLFLPRLIDRSGDVEALTWYFIDEFNRQGFRAVNAVEARAYEALLAYRWPGNVRELRNTIEGAFAIGEGSVLSLSDLPPELRGETEVSRAEMTEKDLDRERILEALNIARGRKSKAAEILNMSRSTLWRKMREYRII